MAAGEEGGNTVVAIGGYEAVRPFVLVDMINGAWGGRDGKDGIEGVTNPSQNMSNLPVETLEARYPLRVEEYALPPNSGGPGDGAAGSASFASTACSPSSASSSSAPTGPDTPPGDSSAAGPGACSRSLIDRGAGWETLPGQGDARDRPGTVIRHEQAGAAGGATRRAATPALVAADVADGKVTAERAQADYGAKP